MCVCFLSGCNCRSVAWKKADTCTVSDVHTHLLDSPHRSGDSVTVFGSFPPVALGNGGEEGLKDGAEGGRKMTKDKNTSEQNTHCKNHV